jgi:hypothetical protein
VRVKSKGISEKASQGEGRVKIKSEEWMEVCKRRERREQVAKPERQRDGAKVRHCGRK